MLNRYRNVAAGILLVAAFAVAWRLVPHQMMLNIVASLLIGIGIAVVWTYGKIGVPAALSRSFGIVEQLAIGITVSWIGVVVGTSLGIYARFDHAEVATLNSPALGFLTYCVGLGGILHLTAPSADDERIMRRGWKSLAFAIGIGALIAGILIGAELAGGIETVFEG